ncbi:MAG: glutamine--tRNA ligase/YqeY domain fusion protein [Deltaproteobacteria bacterium]|nr:glutamine--tRNA ligase/YqeY domain fusion protein [Deltaproteobacteria bacterium]
MAEPAPAPTPANFIRDIIDEHLEARRYPGVVTRFPPEPNGYLHIGHAKSICLNFGLARDYGGVCHLRFDDTNPTKEETEYVDSIQADVRWLGFDWQGKLFFASDYFQRMYDWAELLVRKGLAYVDSLSREELRQHRGSLTEPGRESPYRNRGVDENLDLLRRMKAGEFEDGEHVLRARIDMSSPNMLMRDPPLYRILKAHHHRTGDDWCLYPMYDYAHCLSDAIEGISHSICTLEFENNRELYDWVLDAVGFGEPRPHQYEFARLNLEYTVMSKRKLLRLVKEGIVDGWDDPRMSTIAGYRRRGVRASAIRAFAEMIGVAKTNSVVDIGKLEYCIRDDLNTVAPRVMAVLDPLEVVLENWAEGEVETVQASYWPVDVPREGSRPVPLSKRLYIERGDFAEVPPKGWHRLCPGGDVRLRYGYVITCTGVDKDLDGRVVRLRCEVDRGTRHGAGGASKRRPKGTIHWVSAEHALTREVRLYDHLFTAPLPDREEGDILDFINPRSKIVVQARVEPSLATLGKGEHVQFERHGYFYTDPIDGAFNKVVGLKDGWARVAAQTVPIEPALAVVRPAPTRKTEGARPERVTRAEARERRFHSDPTLRARYERMMTTHGLTEDDAELCAETHALADFAEAAFAAYAKPASVAKWIVNELLRVLKDKVLSDLPVTPAAFARVAELVDAGGLSTSAAKSVLAALFEDGGEADAIVSRLGLAQVSDEAAIAAAAAKVVADNAAQAERYRAGKTQLLGFFVGQVMKAMGGRANPEVVTAVVTRALG